MRKLTISIGLLIALIFTVTYVNVINQPGPVPMIRLNPPSEFIKYEVDGGNSETYVYRNSQTIKKLHEKITVKSSKIFKDISDFKDITKFDYGYKGVTLWIDKEGRIVVPVRIIDLKEASKIDYIVWKVYQVVNKEYFIYYVSDPDESVVELVKTIEFELLDD